MVAPVGDPQESRHGGATPTRSQLFQGEMHPVDPALTLGNWRRSISLGWVHRFG
ncbi:hypothetical protein [Prochlorothrix hollandica]|uniref:hypothetical protein n=1 Tax=Prochlorothrix hollandica TaxID=1223 RepID=UPI003DA72582